MFFNGCLKYDKIKLEKVDNMEELISRLNQEQKQAVTANKQYMRVIAGAGSGKTRVLTTRIVYLVKEQGISPSSILAITFTNKAANEMKNRVLEEIPSSPNMAILTFHSFCNRLLRENIKVLDYPSSFVIVDEDEKQKIIKRLIKDFGVKDTLKPSVVINYISSIKNGKKVSSEINEIEDDHTIENILKIIYKKYEKYLNERKYIDFDDMLIYAVKILKEYPKIREKYQDRYQYILVDEFQDTNEIQYELVNLLMAKKSSLFVVGDPDQNIYTWRGSNAKIILDLGKHYKDLFDVVLHQNYRSTPEILSVANTLIQNNKQRIHKDLTTSNSSGGQVLYFEAASRDIEARWVVERIRELKRINPQLEYRDFAVLYRSNYYSRDIEDKCLKYGVPYKIFGGVRFFERKEVKDAIAYLRLITNQNDDLAFERIINTPKRGVGDRTLDTILFEAEKRGVSLYSVAFERIVKLKGVFTTIGRASKEIKEEGANFAEVLKSVLIELGYYDMVLKQDDLENEDRIKNIESVFDYLYDEQQNNPNIGADEILQNIALISSQDEMEDNNHINLMTVHTAKGLEFPFVFIIGLSEKVFPSVKSIHATSLNQEDDAALEEERRLAYVAFTRAEKQLFLTCSTGFNYSVKENSIPSRFIEEIKAELTPYYSKQTFSDPKNKVKRKRKINESSTMVDTNVDYRPGLMVNHMGFGEGLVVAIEDDVLTIAFKDPSVGVKKISKNFRGLTKK